MSMGGNVQAGMADLSQRQAAIMASRARLQAGGGLNSTQAVTEDTTTGTPTQGNLGRASDEDIAVLSSTKHVTAPGQIMFNGRPILDVSARVADLKNAYLEAYSSKASHNEYYARFIQNGICNVLGGILGRLIGPEAMEALQNEARFASLNGIDQKVHEEANARMRLLILT
jgi:hypothetical protein